MAVFDGASGLATTLDSILSQEDAALEVICVDDGSRDDSPAILEAFSRSDARVRLFRQDHSGLTTALIRGCSEAASPVIARCDVGDRYLPGRLTKQVDELERHADTVLVSCGTRFLTPAGHVLYESTRSAAEAANGLAHRDLRSLMGPPHHGATAFRRDAYVDAGGYRSQFRVAQDLDLWLRLIERGAHRSLPEILYEASFRPDSLSGLYRKAQLRSTKIALACADARRAGQSEAALLARCALIERTPPGRLDRARRRANAYYFMGSCLRAEPSLAGEHFRNALRSWPFHLRAWVALATLKVRSS
jgi:glycosyltransferase involved in cell wall biosynthesis